MSENDGYLRPGLIGDVRNAIADNMAKNGTDEQPGALGSHTPIEANDLMNQFGHLLNDETKVAMSTTVKSMIQVEDDHTLSQVRYLGKKTTADNIGVAAKIVCGHLNELAASGFIKGSLLPLFKLDFAPLENKELAVLSYVMLTDEGVKFYDETLQNVKVEEGGMPSEV